MSLTSPAESRALIEKWFAEASKTALKQSSSTKAPVYPQQIYLPSEDDLQNPDGYLIIWNQVEQLHLTTWPLLHKQVQKVIKKKKALSQSTTAHLPSLFHYIRIPRLSKRTSKNHGSCMASIEKLNGKLQVNNRKVNAENQENDSFKSHESISEERSHDEVESNSEDDLSTQPPAPLSSTKLGKRKSVVDDPFFELSQMEAFVQQAEELERKRNLNSSHTSFLETHENSEDEDDEAEDATHLDASLYEDLDMYQEDAFDSEALKYGDYFEDIQTTEAASHSQSKQKLDLVQQDFDDLDKSDEDDSDVDEEGKENGSLDEEEDENGSMDDDLKMKEIVHGTSEKTHRHIGGSPSLPYLSKTSDTRDAASNATSSNLKNNSNLIADSIDAFEADIIADKHWSVLGEAKALDRPKNSLLELHLELPQYKSAELYMKEQLDSKNVHETDGDKNAMAYSLPQEIEVIVRNRIDNALFDDVIRIQPSCIPQPLASDLSETPETLDFKKSSASLGDIYAQKYEREILRKSMESLESSASSPLNPLDLTKKKIHEMFSKIMHKLDCLSNYHFVPRPPQSTSGPSMDVAAVTVEEPVPVVLSLSTRSAPSNLNISKVDKELSEMDQNERAGIRRANKIARKKKVIARLRSGESTLTSERERAKNLSQKNIRKKADRLSIRQTGLTSDQQNRGSLALRNKNLRASALAINAARASSARLKSLKQRSKKLM